METPKKPANAQGAEGKKDNVRAITQTVPAPAVKSEAVELAKTIKAITDLHRLIRHRDLLEQHRDELRDFELKHKDIAFEDKNIYVNCSLKITDDKNRVFEIKSPSVIKATAEFLHGQFDVKLKETEAQIILPTNKAA